MPGCLQVTAPSSGRPFLGSLLHGTKLPWNRSELKVRTAAAISGPSEGKRERERGKAGSPCFFSQSPDSH